MSSKKIVIIDHGLGNILSLKRAIEVLGYNVSLTSDRSEILNSSHIFLPGVGQFTKAIEIIKKKNLFNFLRTLKKKNILGICLGMQLLFSYSDEEQGSEGLSFFKEKIIKIQIPENDKKDNKVPNIGWRKIYTIDKDNILKNIKNFNFYFIHSYMAQYNNDNCLAFITYSNIKIPAVVRIDNIYGCQFHPEKSSTSGLQFIKNFIEI
jgi:glutamine amidotransferase